MSLMPRRDALGAHGSHNAVHGVACILHLGKQAVFAQQGIIADAAGNVVAGLAGNGDNVVLPLCRSVDAEQMAWSTRRPMI